jgi:hypothetical protein
MTEQMIIQHAGLAALMQRPLIETISAGVRTESAGAARCRPAR